MYFQFVKKRIVSLMLITLFFSHISLPYIGHAEVNHPLEATSENVDSKDVEREPNRLSSEEKEEKSRTASEQNDQDVLKHENATPHGETVNNPSVSLQETPSATQEFSPYNIDIKDLGDTVRVTLTNSPNTQLVMEKLKSYLQQNRHITNLIISGEFGLDNGNALQHTPLKTVRFENSNYVPSQMLRGAYNLEKYSDDGTVTSINAFALNHGSYTNSKLREIDSPNLQNLDENNLEKFKGTKLDFPNLVTALHGNFRYMPNVQEINLPKLQSKIEAPHWNFNDMPSVKKINLPQVTEAIIAYTLFDLRNQQPTYVDLTSLQRLSKSYESAEMYFGSKKEDAKAPIYIKLGQKLGGDLYNQDTNAFFYTGVNPQTTYEITKEDAAIEVSAFGTDDFRSYNTTDIKIGWLIDGALSKETGESISIDPKDYGVGEHKLKPIVIYNGIEDRNFFKDDIVVNIKDIVKEITAKAVPQKIALGGEIPVQKAKELVTDVRLGEQVLQPSEYDVEIVQKANTKEVGDTKAKVRVTATKANVCKEIDVPVNIFWKHTLGSDNVVYKGYTGFAISLLTDTDIPVLVSTFGIGGKQGSWINDHRNGTYIQVDLFDIGFGVNLNDKSPYFSQKINGQDSTIRAEQEFNARVPLDKIKYGDVLRYDVDPRWGDNKWVWINGEKRFESKGQRDVYYELTKDGYQPLRINQLTAKTVHVKNGASTEELNQKLKESIDVKEYNNIAIERFKDKLPNVEKDGEQKVDVIVSETLQSGKKVEYTYTVTFVVNPVVTENIYSSDGELMEMKQTELQYGKDTFTPDPKERFELDGNKYKYDGWLSAQQKPGEDSPKEGRPNEIKETTTFHYIYSNLNKMIHVTLPTEMIFSSSDPVKKEIQSNRYRIENHSDDARLNIKLASFEAKDQTGIQLLKHSDPDPVQPTEAMRLHLLVNGEEKIKSLNDNLEMQDMGTMNPKEMWTMQFGGTYFGEITEYKKNTQHSMTFKFSVDF
ncbi:hypothetical protein [Bacillus thuringiensis]|uniref:hypothetical protein n=1 Tax=Bacillus thuringiensis TaxID=1428 RepID=UPI000BF6EDE2|nr:hypothetical protein [Bacillus thuringiensis]PFN47090.1 hypothetical protein COJ75_30115 [Bacillus thuringiensis]